MLNQDEELWEKELSASVEKLLVEEAASDRGHGPTLVSHPAHTVHTTISISRTRSLYQLTTNLFYPSLLGLFQGHIFFTNVL